MIDISCPNGKSRRNASGFNRSKDPASAACSFARSFPASGNKEDNQS
tara:strand:- start:4026 stop:4166 length:141 start_codon:yes stop_codon:yes gene_type:complete